MLVAGLTAGVSAELGIDTGSTDIVDRIRTNLVEAGVGTAVDVTVSGAEFGDSLLDHLAFAAVDTIGAEGAEAIGKAYHSGDIDRLTRYLAHAGLGCAIGAASGECRAGAIGAVAGEFAADQFRKELLDAVAEGDLTPEQALEWDKRGVDIARLAGALAVAVSGGDEAAVNTAADTAENAARENAFWIPILVAIAAILEVVDRVILARDVAAIGRSGRQRGQGSHCGADGGPRDQARCRSHGRKRRARQCPGRDPRPGRPARPRS